MDGQIPLGLCQCGCGRRTRVSPYNDAPRGYVKGQPRPFCLGHRREQKQIRYLKRDRGFDTPCWVWQLALASNGYGAITRKGTSAHRWYYEQANGPIPAGAHIDHLCRVRACVNPAHMQVVTCAENARRGDNAKLTYEDVEEIKRLRASGLLQREVGARFSVTRQAVGDIENGRTWAAPGGLVIANA